MAAAQAEGQGVANIDTDSDRRAGSFSDPTGCAAAAAVTVAARSLAALRRAARAALPGDDGAREVDLLIAHALGRSTAWLFAHGEFAPSEGEAAQIEALIAQRARGVPVAQLTGRRGFWTLDLSVNAHTLIPRPETELLVELALARLPQDHACLVADLGTGSGAIALALASERPRAQVIGSDISFDALQVARANAQQLGLPNVEFRLGDWCSVLAAPERFDLIVSNPPYIADSDPHLVQGDLRFEPRGALASGVDGLDAIRCIVSAAPRHLKVDGWLLLEHGYRQGAAARALLAASLREVGSARDHAGHERVSLGRR